MSSNGSGYAFTWPKRLERDCKPGGSWREKNQGLLETLVDQCWPLSLILHLILQNPSRNSRFLIVIPKGTRYQIKWKGYRLQWNWLIYIIYIYIHIYIHIISIHIYIYTLYIYIYKQIRNYLGRSFQLRRGISPRNTPGQMAPNSLASSSATGAPVFWRWTPVERHELKLNESAWDMFGICWDMFGICLGYVTVGSGLILKCGRIQCSVLSELKL